MKNAMEGMFPGGSGHPSAIPELLLKPLFWFSALGASAFRALTGEMRPVIARIFSFTAAVFAAAVFTEPLARRFGFDRDGIYAVAAVVALTGEHAMALLASRPERIIDVWKRFRGRA